MQTFKLSNRYKFTALRPLLLGALLVSATGIVGCGDEEPEQPTIKRKSRKKKKKEQAADDAAAKGTDDLAFTYDAVNRRDPFKTYFDELMIEDEKNRALTELQRFELDSLELVGVVVGTATPMALIEDPGGKGHTVKIGTLVGKHLGQIKHIRRGEVIVQEEFRDFSGRRITQLKSLKVDSDDIKAKKRGKKRRK